jgi:hypothetical protein
MIILHGDSEYIRYTIVWGPRQRRGNDQKIDTHMIPYSKQPNSGAIYDIYFRDASQSPPRDVTVDVSKFLLETSSADEALRQLVETND